MQSKNNKFNLFSSEPVAKHKVEFRINYKTDFGQVVCIIGSIPELGSWKSFTKVMKWSDGNIWRAQLETVYTYFEYKYVIIDSSTKKSLRWESGINRLADLVLLEIEKPHEDFKIQNDEWERYLVVFSIYFPLKNEENEYMRLNGDIPELGNWNKGDGPVKMTKGEEITWLTGARVRPWEFRLRQAQTNLSQRLTYKYSIKNDDEDYTIWEREPSRYMTIQEPSLYKGELGQSGSSKWPNVEEVFLVNGLINKADANFVGGLSFDKIGDTHLFIGPYPQLEEDVRTMAEAGVTGVFNVQTEIDFAHRGINWEKMLEYYRSYGIKAVHYPIHDFNEEDLKSKLYKASQVLNDLINTDGLDVYVHCTAGMGRAPASCLVYLCLFKGMDPEEADIFVKSYRKVSVPNMRAVKEVVEKYQQS